MIEDEDILYVNPKQKEVRNKAPFYNAAANGKFGEGYFKTLGRKNTVELKDDWLHKREFEKPESYFRRLQNIQNPTYAKKIIQTYVGTYSKNVKNIEIESDDETSEKFLTNIDNKGHGINSFLNAVADQMLEQGKVFTLTEKIGEVSSLPYTVLIRRQDCLDKSQTAESENYELFKFVRRELVLAGIRTVQKEDIIIYTPDKVYTCILINDKYDISEVDNTLGFVPIRTASLGFESVSILVSAAHMDIDLLNATSEVRDLLSLQSFNILGMCQSAKESLTVNNELIISAQSVIAWPDEYSGNPPAWIDYKTGSLTGFYTYIEATKSTLHELANIRRLNTKSSQESGKKAKMDFLDTESVLNVLADESEDIFHKTIKDWAAFTGRPITGTISISREWDIETINEQLERIELALGMELGEVANIALKKKVINSTVDLTEEEKKEAIIDLELIENLRKKKVSIADLGYSG